MKTPQPTRNSLAYRVRADGEHFRRYHIFITQKQGFVAQIEMCDPSICEHAQTHYTADLIAHLDVFDDGSYLVMINHERSEHALLDLTREFETMEPLNKDRDDGIYFMRGVRDSTRFLVLCGSEDRQ